MPDPILANQPPIIPPSTFPEMPDIPPAPQEASEPINIPPIVTSSNTPKKRSGKLIATILGIFLLIGAVGAGVVLVGQKQLFRQKAAGQCPVINGCVADHPESRCNDQGQMCTFYIGEPGYEVTSCTSGANNAGCPSGYYCMHYNTCYACVQNSTCYWKEEDNCVVDESCGGSPPTYTPTPTPPNRGCGEECNDYIHCISSLNCPGGPGGGHCVNGACPQDPDCVCNATPTPTPTPPNRGCGEACNDYIHCIPSLNCPGGPSGGRCVNGLCPNDPDCVCATPTPTPVLQCNSHCTPGSSNCPSGLFCYPEGGEINSGNCRNAQCATKTNCICARTPTPTPTGVLRACNTSCQADSQCSTGYCTTGGVCRNHDCPNDTDCNCSVTNTPTPTPTRTATPTPTPGINAMCSVVKAYDTNWNLLTSAQLSALKAGDKVRFTVSGIPADQIDKARFTINGVLGPEVTTKKPGTNEYYYEYTIPTGVYSFTVTAQIHHLTLGWF